MIDMVIDDDADLDTEDDHIDRGGDDQEEVGHVHQPGVGHGDDDGVVWLVYLIYIKSCSGSMTSNHYDHNAVQHHW